MLCLIHIPNSFKLSSCQDIQVKAITAVSNTTGEVVVSHRAKARVSVTVMGTTAALHKGVMALLKEAMDLPKGTMDLPKGTMALPKAIMALLPETTVRLRATTVPPLLVRARHLALHLTMAKVHSLSNIVPRR